MKNRYFSNSETNQFLYKLQDKYPNLIKIKSIGTTWENRDILLATISLDVVSADKKPALLYTGTAHAREWIGNELAVHFIEYIVKNYQFDPRLSQTLNRTTLYIIPCLNPDGFEYSRNHFSFWRKNRRDNGDGTFGVDLNRNFSIGYQKSTDTSSNVYSGKEPFSEAETLAIKNFVDSHKNITIALDYHSQGNVFFPAHKFKHEQEIDGTDLNTLCANMAYEINKVTGRRYGIHRGKPPTKLISGSGREYYYSKGILSAVIEVGTRNIPDYIANMSDSVNENISALIYALSEVENYSSNAPKRVDNFIASDIGSDFIKLSWDFEQRDDIYFEIYRNMRFKQACNASNLIAITKANFYEDIQLGSNKIYFYYIRVVNKKTKIKSPFAPRIRVRTTLDRDEFSQIVFPSQNAVGYVGEFTKEKNRDHFGHNSLFIGVNKNIGKAYGVIDFNLDSIPSNAIIKEAKLSIYPLNRVGVKIESYGVWSIDFLKQNSVAERFDYDQIDNAEVIHSIGEEIRSEKLTQGIWHSWTFNQNECKILEQRVAERKLLFRIKGATELPMGRDSQMMQFDIGYGKFGSGIHYRPYLDIKYSMPSQKVEIEDCTINSVSTAGVQKNTLVSGFDQNGAKIYGHICFKLDSLPDPNSTVITQAYVELENKNRLKNRKDFRINIDFANVKEVSYQDIQTRNSIDYVGYELGNEDLKFSKKHLFLFDLGSIIALENLHKKEKNVSLILRATTSSAVKNTLIKWYEHSKDFKPRLVIEYKERDKKVPSPISNFRATKEKGVIKLTWTNPKDENFKGVYVVRNRFRSPASPFDGVKLYAGKDNYTLDDFGSLDVDKYYTIFSYNDVPIYSEPITLEYFA